MSTVPVTPAAPSGPPPSAPSTPAPVSPTPAAPVAPVAPAAPASSSSLRERIASGWKKTVEDTKLETPETPVVEAAPAPGEGSPTPQETPAEVTEPGKPAEAVEAKPAETPAEEVPELDDGVNLAPADFAKELKGSEAEKWLNEHPEIKGKLFSALREREEMREIRQIIPDVETARNVAQAAATFQTVDNHFLDATSPEGAQKFLEYWAREAMITDDQGQPQVKDGQVQFHPALTYVFDHITSNRVSATAKHIERTGQLPPEFAPILTSLEKYAKTSGNERLQAAMEVAREEIPRTSPGSGEVPDELKPYAESLSAREREIQEREQKQSRELQTQRDTAHQQSVDNAEIKASDSVKGQLKPLFAKAGLTEFETDAASRKIAEEVDTLLEGNALYQSQLNALLRREPGETREKAHLKLIMGYVNTQLGSIAARVVREAKAGALNRQSDRQTRIAAQTEQSKTDPKGTSITPSKPQPQTPKEMRETITAEYKAAHNGQEPDREYVMQEAWKRTASQKR